MQEVGQLRETIAQKDTLLDALKQQVNDQQSIINANAAELAVREQSINVTKAQMDQIKEKYEELLQEHGNNKSTLLSSNAKLSQLTAEL